MEKTGREYKTSLSIITDRNMSVEEGSSAGGIILMSLNRRITV